LHELCERHSTENE
jgi:hypothetical protein